MMEFKYKGTTVRPYEPFYYNKSEGYMKGSLKRLARTILADEHPLAVIIEVGEETDINMRKLGGGCMSYAKS